MLYSVENSKSRLTDAKVQKIHQTHVVLKPIEIKTKTKLGIQSSTLIIILLSSRKRQNSKTIVRHFKPVYPYTIFQRIKRLVFAARFMYRAINIHVNNSLWFLMSCDGEVL